MRARTVAFAALGLAASLSPASARAQAISFGIAPAPGGTVVGRVCVDRDGDGSCGGGEPGVAGARILGEGGQVALADGDGRFHLLEVPGRLLFPDRVAYGGHVLAAEGLGVRRAFELAPLGAASVNLAVPPPPSSASPALVAYGSPGGAPERAPAGRLLWDLGGLTTPGSAVAIGEARATAGADGAFAIRVLLAPGPNRLGVAVVTPGGGGAIFAWTVNLAARPSGGDLVAPEPPVRLATFDQSARAGGALVVGRAAEGRRLRVGGVVPAPAPDGAFAAFAPGASPRVEVLEPGGAADAVAFLPGVPDRGLGAVAGLAEIEVSLFGEPRLLVTGRGAAAARGRVGRLDLEAGVDLDDRDRHGGIAELARPRDALAIEHALDPARTLAVTGDEGAADDRNPGRGRVWARVQGEGVRVDLGSARAGLTGSELGRYDRALFGGKARGEAAVGPVRLDAGAFGATLRDDAGGNAPPAPAHDVLAATGGAVLWLSHGAVVPGSEALRVEWRDPLTNRLAGQRALVRGRDYEIDWVAGRVALAAPLASVGGAPAIYTGDPFTAPRALVVADYLRATAGPGSEDLAGGRVGAAAGPLSVSAHAAGEDRPEGRYRLAGGSAELDLGPALGLRAEAARSRGALFARGGPAGFSRSLDGGYEFGAAQAEGPADALHVEGRAAAGPARVLAWWRERGAGYSDAEFQEALAARERGAEAAVEGGALSASVLVAERRGADPDDPAGLQLLDVRHLVARAGWTGDRLALVAEAVRMDRDAPSAAEETSAGARARWQLDPSLALDLSHHQGIHTSGAGRDPTFTAAGVSLASGKDTLSVRGGWGPELGPRLLVSGERGGPREAVYGTFTADPDAPHVLGRGEATALGTRRRVDGAEVFTEEQFARDAFGLRAGRVVGAAVEPLRGLRISLAGERGERLRLDGSHVARSAAAAAAGFVAGPLRLAARGEARGEGDDGQVAAAGSAEWAPGRGASVAVRASWLHGTISGREALEFEASVAAALRRDRWSLLGSVARLAERRPGEARRDSVVARLAASADAARRVELGVGAGLALQRAEGGRDDRIAGSARARVRIAGPLDVAAEYARRAPLRGDALGSLDAVRAEVGVSERESRVAIGYTFVGFGGDGLTPATETSRLYVRAQVTY